MTKTLAKIRKITKIQGFASKGIYVSMNFMYEHAWNILVLEIRKTWREDLDFGDSVSQVGIGGTNSGTTLFEVFLNTARCVVLGSFSDLVCRFAIFATLRSHKKGKRLVRKFHCSTFLLRKFEIGFRPGHEKKMLKTSHVKNCDKTPF